MDDQFFLAVSEFQFRCFFAYSQINMVFGWGKSAAQKQKEEEQASQIIQLRHQLEQTSDLYARYVIIDD